MAERALEAMKDRATSRTAFGKLLAEQDTVVASIAQSRLEIEQARYCLSVCVFEYMCGYSLCALCVYVHVCTCVCMCVYGYTYVCAYMYTCMRLCMCVCVCVCVRACVCARMHWCVGGCVHAFACNYVYTVYGYYSIWISNFCEFCVVLFTKIIYIVFK